MNEQKELTKAELQIMQVLWQKENAFVNEILQELEEPRPAYNTVSTVLRVLQNKGFVAYRSFLSVGFKRELYQSFYESGCG